MRKTIYALLFSTLTLTATAQHKATLVQGEGPRALQTSIQEGTVRTTPKTYSHTPKGDRAIIFHETFENGFTGTTEYGPWTFSHKLTGVESAQGSMWSIGHPGYQNAYGLPSDSLASDTPQNWALWDGAAYYSQYPSSGSSQGSYYTAYLNAPTIDCSDMASVVISFQQTFRYCCFPTSPISVDVSTDGGTTWNTFDAIDIATEGSNIASPNPMNTTIDLSCVAAGEPNVQIRFAYNSKEEAGYTHYYWGIDEVKIFENEEGNNLYLDELICGDIFSNWEFRVTPQEQIRSAVDGGVIAGVKAGNLGLLSDSAYVIFTFVSPSNDTTSFETERIFLYSAMNDTLCPSAGSSWFLWETGFVPTEMGKYNFSATIYGSNPESEEAFLNNTIEESLIFNNIGEYGHDGDVPEDFQYQVGSRFVTGTAGPREPSGFGSHFSFVNPGSKAHGITVRFGSNTAEGIEFKAALIEQETSSLDNSLLIASGNYETREGWNNAEPLYFAFNSSTPVNGAYPAQSIPVQTWNPQTGPNYVAAIWRQNSGIGNLTVRSQIHKDVDNSSVSWEKGGDQSFHWFHYQEFNYAVRLVTSNENHTPVAVEEPTNTPTGFSIYPNPAVNEARIAFNLTESTFIAYEVRDLQGRLIDTDNIGRFGAGENSFSLNVSSYAPGNYIVGLVIDGKQILTQQLSIIK